MCQCHQHLACWKIETNTQYLTSECDVRKFFCVRGLDLGLIKKCVGKFHKIEHLWIHIRMKKRGWIKQFWKLLFHRRKFDVGGLLIFCWTNFLPYGHWGDERRLGFSHVGCDTQKKTAHMRKKTVLISWIRTARSHSSHLLYNKTMSPINREEPEKKNKPLYHEPMPPVHP